MAAGDMITLNVQNLDRTQDVLKRYQWKTLGLQWADRMAPKLVNEIKREAPHLTGHLRNATTVKVESSATRIRLVFSAPGISYVPFVIHGTPPHKIFPKSKRALHWTTNGANAFARQVSHPGTRPNNYPETAARRTLGDVSRAMSDVLNNLQK